MCIANSAEINKLPIGNLNLAGTPHTPAQSPHKKQIVKINRLSAVVSKGKQSMAAMEKLTKGVENAVHVCSEETSLFRFNIQQLLKLTTSEQMILSLHQAKKLTGNSSLKSLHQN